jgi:hypothetical protein
MKEFGEGMMILLEHELVGFVNLFVVGTTSDGDGDGPGDSVGECFHSIRNEWLLLLWVILVNLEFKRQTIQTTKVRRVSWDWDLSSPLIRGRNIATSSYLSYRTYNQTIIPQGFVIIFGGWERVPSTMKYTSIYKTLLATNVKKSKQEVSNYNAMVESNV